MSEVLETVLSRFSRQLQAAGVDSARLDSRLLVAKAAKKTPNELILRSYGSLSPKQLEHAESLIQRRLNGEPVSRILGEREFWGLLFKLSRDTLDPRPDSETVVSAALSIAGRQNISPKAILDLGTGSGCLLLSLLWEWRDAFGVGIDIAPDAVATARQNAIALGVENRAAFLAGDWFSSMAATFDVIVSNPPYVRRADIDTLAPEVRSFDPSRALDGGSDGLAAYRVLIPKSAEHLCSGGVLVLEIGAGQEDAVTTLLQASGLHRIESFNDLGGYVRCLSATAP